MEAAARLGVSQPYLAMLERGQRRPTPKLALRADLEPRLVEALPWLVLRYSTLDWSWVVREAKMRDLQNRLGLVVGLARQLAVRVGDERKARSLVKLEAHLDRSRLAREDTLCRASLPEPERRWLAERRPEAAKHWNLLTDWTADALRHRA